jgi:hydrogenase expression/formation protein HypD
MTETEHIAPFRDLARAEMLLAHIARLADRLGATPEAPLAIMEICGGHTHAIFRYGLNQLVHPGIEFVHGPGCPVCVLPMARVDECVALAEQPNVIMTSFGDAMRVPGHHGSLIEARARGADIRIVYSPLDALALARRTPDREIIFFGLGFETTTPATALVLLQAEREDLTNFFLFCNHITVPPPLRALLEDPECRLGGFIGPGHVSMVIGLEPYRFIAEEFHRPIVIAGFEPIDLLHTLCMVLAQRAEGRTEVENQYGRVVPRHGNRRALEAIETVFEPRERFEWRGLGEIDRSGLRIRPRFSRFDAEARYSIGYGASAPRSVPEIPGARCGDVVKGVLKPPSCPLFGTACTPRTPVGALMVSSEGACAAYHQYAGSRPEAPSPARAA